ncbi:MAG: rod shape-determining protein MreC [Oscillospiraceae bacterium]|nr:rod shape-determining protein MreC [Oscillospiraceae bacterium]
MTTATILSNNAPLSGAWRAAFTPAERSIAAVRRRVTANDTQAEVYDLHGKIADMEAASRQIQAIVSENDRLRTLLNLPTRQRELTLVMANVIGFSGGNTGQFFTIDRGERYGVAAGMSVIDEHRHLAGIVAEAGDTWANVQAITDAHMRIGAMIEQTSTIGVAVGHFDDMQQNKLRLAYLPDDARVNAGDLVVTSGANDTFPDGLIIGMIESVCAHESGLGQLAKIAPNIEYRQLRTLFVITDFINER